MRDLPDALLFTTPGCMHCLSVWRGLDELQKEGLVGKVTLVDATEHPELAAEYGVRAAPWLRLGAFTLTGAHTLHELRQWAAWANGEEGAARYVEHLLKLGEFPQAKTFIAADPQRLKPLLAILADPDATIDVRLGVSALLEAYAHTSVLQNLLPQLVALTRHADHRARADACYLLGLSGSADARSYVAVCLDDVSEEVREIAREAMAALAKRNGENSK
jgi:thioredoxin-like negative regulator of GroEL